MLSCLSSLHDPMTLMYANQTNENLRVSTWWGWLQRHATQLTVAYLHGLNLNLHMITMDNWQLHRGMHQWGNLTLLNDTSSHTNYFSIQIHASKIPSSGLRNILGPKPISLYLPPDSTELYQMLSIYLHKHYIMVCLFHSLQMNISINKVI